MNWNTYKIMSEKTLSTEFHYQKQDELLLHAVMGVITELEELTDWNDEVNKKEEVADCFWYLAIIDRELDLNMDLSVSFPIENYDNNQLFLLLYSKSSLLLDMLKKRLFYNKEINTQTFSTISLELFSILISFCKRHDIDVETILDTNIAKLKARYGDKFSSERAINRNLDIERNILSNNG